jgi:TonB family protein
VLPDGTVGQVRVVKSLDKPTGLDDQALGAAREWMFTPGTLDGKPVSMRLGIVLTFSRQCPHQAILKYVLYFSVSIVK